MSKKMKNIAQSEVLALREQISFRGADCQQNFDTKPGSKYLPCSHSQRAKRSAPMNRVGTPSSPCLMVIEKSRLMARITSAARRRIYCHASRSSPCGIWAGSVQDAFSSCILIKRKIDKGR